jgi:hypothetical protein
MHHNFLLDFPENIYNRYDISYLLYNIILVRMLQETGLEEWMGAETQIERISGFIGAGYRSRWAGEFEPSTERHDYDFKIHPLNR